MMLDGKAALVTGGRRIGAEVARQLARRGMDVAVSYQRSRQQASETVRAIEASGRRGLAIAADLRDPNGCTELVAQAAAAFGRLDVLVHMASVYVRQPLAATGEAAWAEAMHVDLRAAFVCVQAALPHFRAAGGGRIVNVSDWVAASGRPRYPGYLPYYVAKKAVIGLSEALALELAADRVLVNTVAPGPILPPEGSSAAHISAVEAATPLRRWGGEAAIAHAVLFCLESEFMTGETIRVDGGRHVL
jgi:NAD(P)-dependent dehydrogenase (short-subunit alcohol dehydrogenase family)